MHLDEIADPRQALERAARAGVGAVVAVSSGLASGEAILELAECHPPVAVGVALGIQPERAGVPAAEVEAVVRLISSRPPRCVALGEVGIAHYRLRQLAASEADRERTRSTDLLERLLAVAAQVGLPVILHAVHDDAARALARVPAGCRAVFHWTKAPPPVIDAIVAAGHLVSVTPDVQWRERDRAMALRAGLEHIVLETDAPWPLRAGAPAAPELIPRVGEHVAAIFGCAAAEVAQRTRRNSLSLFSRLDVEATGGGS